jgi:hypothetical protein
LSFHRSSSQPNVNQVDGEYSYDPQRHTLDWQIAIINSSNKEGVLEFNVAGDDVDAFFPTQVSFYSEKLLCNVDVSCVFILDLVWIDWC